MQTKSKAKPGKDIEQPDMSNEYVGADFVLPIPSTYGVNWISKKELKRMVLNERSVWDLEALAKLSIPSKREYTCANCPLPHDPAFKCGENNGCK